MMEIILVDLGNFQEYIIDNIKQLQLFDYHVTVIITQNLLYHFKDIPNIKVILTSELDNGTFNEVCHLDSTFRGGFWRLASERLFYLWSYLKKYKVSNCFHIENDIMVYRHIHVPDTTKVWLTMDASQRCIPGIIYLPHANALDDLVQRYDGGQNDMVNMAAFYYRNRDLCKTFPIINRNAQYSEDNQYNTHFDAFHSIFDAAAIGQYLGGVDPRNIPSDSRGFVNETCVVQYSNYKFMWKFNVALQLYQPYIIIDEVSVPICNLHIHSKCLRDFSSVRPNETLLIPFEQVALPFATMPNEQIITGERLQMIADVYLGLPDDFRFNPVIAGQDSKLLDIDSICGPYHNPHVVFCYGHRLSLLQTKLSYFTNPFVLISHNSDENISAQYRNLVLSDKLIRWYAQNPLFVHPKLHLLPIGIANSMWQHGNLGVLSNAMKHASSHKTNDIYFYFTVSTNSAERQLCKTELEKKGLVFGGSYDYSTYLSHLATHRFAICPPGNGIDSHRIWECYYLGVIPIVLKNTFTEMAHKQLPCIELSSWSEFDKDVIIPQYHTLIQNLYAKQHLLTIQHYQSQIKRGPIKTVWFNLRGRTGNNIFQYIAAEVIKHIYQFDVVRMTTYPPANSLEITDREYKSIYEDYLSQPRLFTTSHSDIFLNGYFQYSEILIALRSVIRPLFNPYNTTPINNTYKVSDFSGSNTIHQPYFDSTALVLHLRLDDFIHHNNPPNILDKTALGQILDRLTFSRLIIVCDVLHHDWEKRYMQYFIDHYSPILLSGSLLDDFIFLKNSNRLFTSSSTFSWIAAYLGDGEEVHIPYSRFHNDQQILEKCHDHCTLHYNIPFSTDLLS